MSPIMRPSKAQAARLKESGSGRERRVTGLRHLALGMNKPEQVHPAGLVSLERMALGERLRRDKGACAGQLAPVTAEQVAWLFLWIKRCASRTRRPSTQSVQGRAGRCWSDASRVAGQPSSASSGRYGRRHRRTNSSPVGATVGGQLAGDAVAGEDRVRCISGGVCAAVQLAVEPVEGEHLTPRALWGAAKWGWPAVAPAAQG